MCFERLVSHQKSLIRALFACLLHTSLLVSTITAESLISTIQYKRKFQLSQIAKRVTSLIKPLCEKHVCFSTFNYRNLVFMTIKKQSPQHKKKKKKRLPDTDRNKSFAGPACLRSKWSICGSQYKIRLTPLS